MAQYTMMSDLVGLRVFQRKARSSKKGDQAKEKRFGKVSQLVFSPEGTRVVGFIVRRPDVAGMVKRDDVFVALDSFEHKFDSAANKSQQHSLVISDSPEAIDDAARKRLGLEWDSCIIWGGMDVATEAGEELGHITDVRFNEQTGDVAFIGVSDGGMAQSVVGQLEIPSGMLKGYSQGHMVVDDRASELKLSGGLAGKAGEVAAKAKESSKEAGKELGRRANEISSKAQEKAAEILPDAQKTAGELIDKGAHGLGKTISRTGKMFKDFKREFDENSK